MKHIRTPKKINKSKDVKLAEVDIKAPVIPQDSPEDIICFCRHINRLAIEKVIFEGVKSASEITKRTGAGSECGCCQIYIKDMLGESLWLSVSLVLHHYSPDYCAFRFKRNDDKIWTGEDVGTYVIFQVKIDGVWTGRPYALSDDGTISNYREIVIKHKKGGVFTDWLFENFNDLKNTPIRISQGIGGIDLMSMRSTEDNVYEPFSMICIIGGVGITPILALCRKIAKYNLNTHLLIDYSASIIDDFFCHKELLEITLHNDIHIKFRESKKDGRISQNDINELVKAHPNKNFYVCGPDEFKDTVIDMLRICHIPPFKIIDLESSHTKAEVEEEELLKEKSFTLNYQFLGLAFLVFYILQSFFDLKIELLTVLQNNDTYKIISGLIVIFYIVLQWRLPVIRVLNRNNHALLTKSKHKHNILGAFAPIIFYFHSTDFGYAYLAVLSSIYLGNSFLGYLNGEFISLKYRKNYVYAWTILHITLSSVLLYLSFYHAYLALAYK